MSPAEPRRRIEAAPILGNTQSELVKTPKSHPPRGKSRQKLLRKRPVLPPGGLAEREIGHNLLRKSPVFPQAAGGDAYRALRGEREPAPHNDLPRQPCGASTREPRHAVAYLNTERAARGKPAAVPTTRPTQQPPSSGRPRKGMPRGTPKRHPVTERYKGDCV